MLAVSFYAPLTIAVVNVIQEGTGVPDYVRALVRPEDTLLSMNGSAFEPPDACDLVVLIRCNAPTDLIAKLAKAKLPVLIVEPFHGYHVFHSAIMRLGERKGVLFLPHVTPDEVRTSIRAVRARKALRGKKLLAVRSPGDAMRNELHHTAARAMRKHAEVEVISANVKELQDRAAHFNARAVRTELTRWREDLLQPETPLPAKHQEEVVRLYLAERLLLDETGAIGITVDDVCGFLEKQKLTMPNASYGILTDDGYLVCEEADTGALASQLLVWACTGLRPSMSNLYFSHRQALTACARYADYTAEMVQRDLLLCLRDNRLAAAHFGAAGVIPPEMRRESRQRWIETLPDWKGQSTLAADPKLGPVVLARLSLDGKSVHQVPGEIDGYGHGEQYGWYRRRYFVKLPDARLFAEQMEHHHYAIGLADEAAIQTLRTLLYLLLGFEAS